jgi:ATP-binding cassette, subfamily F, member 2
VSPHHIDCHPQDFLNGVCTHMIWITKRKLTYYTGTPAPTPPGPVRPSCPIDTPCACLNPKFAASTQALAPAGNYDTFCKTVKEDEVIQQKKHQKEQDDIKHLKEFIASAGTYANLVKQIRTPPAAPCCFMHISTASAGCPSHRLCPPVFLRPS